MLCTCHPEGSSLLHLLKKSTRNKEHGGKKHNFRFWIMPVNLQLSNIIQDIWSQWHLPSTVSIYSLFEPCLHRITQAKWGYFLPWAILPKETLWVEFLLGMPPPSRGMCLHSRFQLHPNNHNYGGGGGYEVGKRAPAVTSKEVNTDKCPNCKWKKERLMHSKAPLWSPWPCLNLNVKHTIYTDTTFISRKRRQ